MKLYLIALFLFVGLALAVPVDNNEKKDVKEAQEAGDDLQGAASGYWGGYISRPYYGGWPSYYRSYRPSYYSSWSSYPGYYEPGWNSWGGSGWRRSYW